MPRRVIQTITNDVAIEAPPTPPNYEVLRRTVQRQKTGSLQEIIPGDRSLFHDTGNDDKSRLFVFITPTNAKILQECDTWYGGGTFTVASKLLTQLYVVLKKYQEKVIPLGFGILPDKKAFT